MLAIDHFSTYRPVMPEVIVHFRSHLTDVLPLGLLHAHQEVIKGGVAVVLPVVLNASALQEASLGQRLPLRLCIERHVQTGHAHLICGNQHKILVVSHKFVLDFMRLAILIMNKAFK